MNEDSSAKGTGKITAAPNPLPWDARVSVTLTWETSPPQQAEIFVSENQGEEKLISRGGSGSCELDWIQPGIDYEFRLYGTEEGRQRLDAVTVRREAIPWKSLLAHLDEGIKQPDIEADEMAAFIARAVSQCLSDPRFPEWFNLWESNGFHVSPVHFYESIPDTRSLDEELWEGRHELEGVDMNRGMQLDLLRNVFPRFQPEFNQIAVTFENAGGGFYVGNGRFENYDPLIAYCMVRNFRPNRIIEVGGGYSTLLLALTARKNGNTSLTCVEPYPVDLLGTGIPGLEALLQTKVETLGLQFFEQLESGDVLFID
jgi:hypothetical protein